MTSVRGYSLRISSSRWRAPLGLPCVKYQLATHSSFWASRPRQMSIRARASVAYRLSG